jgi:hypothetical protein
MLWRISASDRLFRLAFWQADVQLFWRFPLCNRPIQWCRSRPSDQADSPPERVSIGRPAVRAPSAPRHGGRAVPLECSGGGDAPARTRALTIAAFAWTVLPLWVRRQTQWHASLMRDRGSARPRARPRRPQETGRAAAVGNGGRLTLLLPRAARHGSPPRALGSYALCVHAERDAASTTRSAPQMAGVGKHPSSLSRVSRRAGGVMPHSPARWRCGRPVSGTGRAPVRLAPAQQGASMPRMG